MKVNLVVASGAHQGRVIPITGPQFLIGRDATCHLRPASQAVSKRHCGVFIRDGRVYVQDLGSTNGTMVGEELIRGSEVEVQDGVVLKLGPLDFLLQIERVPTPADGTPLPTANPESAAALAAVAAAAATPKAPPRDTTPNPARPAKQDGTPGSKETPALTGSKEAAALKPAIKPAPPTPEQDEHDRIAAMLLGMDDDGAEVPDGSTVMEIPSPLKPDGEKAATAEDKEKDKKPAATREEMTNAASEILRKMMRRPK